MNLPLWWMLWSLLPIAPSLEERQLRTWLRKTDHPVERLCAVASVRESVPTSLRNRLLQAWMRRLGPARVVLTPFLPVVLGKTVPTPRLSRVPGVRVRMERSTARANAENFEEGNTPKLPTTSFWLPANRFGAFDLYALAATLPGTPSLS